jgi:hypothetical protein
MAKKKESKTYECSDCLHSIYVKEVGQLHCTTKIKNRDGLAPSSRVGTAIDCSYYRKR